MMNLPSVSISTELFCEERKKGTSFPIMIATPLELEE
jgi:hypothetical protein